MPAFSNFLLESYPYEIELETLIQKAKHPIVYDIINTRSFLRLKDIRFLGAIDYLFHPNGKRSHIRHTRYQHTIGVAYLAALASDALHLSYSDRGVAVAAALLHDIGHGPLSHSIEPSFAKQFGINHHFATMEAIDGTHPIDRDINKVLKSYQIDINRFKKIVSGSDKSDIGSLFSSPVNLDTIEGISRSYSYINDNLIYPPPSRVLQALLQREASDVKTLDSFWNLKDAVYKRLIHNPHCFLADVICQRYVQENIKMFSREDFYLSELGFRRKHARLFAQLRYYRMLGLGALRRLFQRTTIRIDIVRRAYEVDAYEPLGRFGQEHLRYKSAKWRDQVILDGRSKADDATFYVISTPELPFNDEHAEEYKGRPVLLR